MTMVEAILNKSGQESACIITIACINFRTNNISMLNVLSAFLDLCCAYVIARVMMTYDLFMIFSIFMICVN